MLGGNESIGLDENQAVALPEPGGASCVGAVCPGSRSFLLNARNDGNCTPNQQLEAQGKPSAKCQQTTRVTVQSIDGGKTFGGRVVVPSLPQIAPTCAGLQRWNGMMFFTNPRPKVSVSVHNP